MDSIGERLKTAREKRALDLEQIARETNIMKRYLIALEQDDFQVFPGEPYLLGFLRNYAEYLGLNANDLCSLYRNVKIQEQPVPVQQLLERSPKSKLPVALGAAAAIVAVVIGAWLLFGRNGSGADDTSLAQGRTPQEYVLDKFPFEKRLFEGDSVIYAFKNEKYKIILSAIQDSVILKTPAGDVRIFMGEEAALDLDKNGFPELKAFAGEFSKTDPTKGVAFRFASLAEAGVTPVLPEAQSSTAAVDQSSQIPNTDTTQLDATKPQVLIEAKSTPYPFTMNVTFRGHCMFRYEIDRKERDERYYRKGEQISVSANNGMKIWLSNASSCVVQIMGGGKTATVELGSSGEVAVKSIKWTQNEAGNFTLSSYNVN